MSNASSIPEPKVLLDGLAYAESPRWHHGRLWFAHWGTGEIVAVDLDGSGSELTAQVGTSADVFSCCGFSVGGALEFDGPATVSNTRVLANETTVSSPSGAAIASGAVLSAFYSESAASRISNSTISANKVTATSTAGSARILGAGMTNLAALELSGDHIADNTGVARAPTGLAQGAGIWDGPFPAGPPVRADDRAHRRHPQRSARQLRDHASRRRALQRNARHAEREHHCR